VQYWLEQNARMLAATIQALEVQRMTLTTLKTMNVPMADLTETLRIRPARAREPAPIAPKKEAAPVAAKKEAAQPSAKAQAVVDPMQWWGALTTQFAQLATNAMKDTAADAAKALASGMVKQSLDVAGQAMKTVAGAPARVVAGAAGAAGKAASRAAAKRKRAKPRAKSVASTA